MRYITNALTRLVRARLNYWLGVLVDATLAGCFLVHAMRTMHGAWVTAGGKRARRPGSVWASGVRSIGGPTMTIGRQRPRVTGSITTIRRL
jgi:hypothetical protein